LNVSSKTLKSADVDLLADLLDQGRLRDAEQRAHALLSEHPGAGILWKLLGLALLRQGKDALAALRRAAELMPNDADSLLYAGDAMRDHGRVREAATLYQRAVHANPRLVEAHNNLGNIMLQLGRHDDAITCYRGALTFVPDDAQVLCNLGNALRQKGSLREALAVTQLAIVRDPKLSIAQNNLGLILAAQGEREQAVASFQAALQLSPKYLDAVMNLGNVLRESGARREALATYARAVEIDPSSAEGHCNLGNTLFDLRNFDAAAASFRRALALRPNYAAAHFGLGGALRLQRRPAEAHAACLAALAIDANYPQALALLGELHADEGRFTEAENMFQRAMLAKPDFAFGLVSIAVNRKMSSDDAAWLQSAERLLAAHPPPAEAIHLRFALGKYFDDIQEYERAFNHYREANELSKRFGGKYPRETLSARIDGIIQRFDANFVARQRDFASSSQLPILIVGMPRSGTSLAEQILASHPDACGAGEVTYWDGAFAAFHDAALAGNTEADIFPGLARSYLERLTALGGAAKRTVDKMPANFLYAGLIQAVLPRARIIHMQRHPLDTCLSIYFQNFPNMGHFANDLDDLAFYYDEYLRVTAHWRAVLPAQSFLEVPYEGLVQDQEGWTRRMLEFAGLPWDARCLDFHRTDRVVVTASRWQVRQKMSASSAGRWRHYQDFIKPLERLARSS
jgi:tetratricopeptide (TPR) repeat protein